MNAVRSIAPFALLLVASLAHAADEKPAATKSDDKKPAAEKTDAERIAGLWKLESADGTFELLQKADQKAQLKFEAGKMEFKVLADGNPIATIPADYSLDDKQTPKLLDLVLTGDGGNKPIFLIYEFQDEKLRIRFQVDGAGARPVDFGVPDEKCRILTFIRDKDAK
jgi:uncharacterized protein (TIGR03067 family)